MTATVINAVAVLIGGTIGIVFKSKIKQKYSDAVTKALCLCVILIGVQNALGTANLLCVIICMLLGTLLGEFLRIEDRLDGLGEFIKHRLLKGGGTGRFTEGFMTSTLIFCIGAMAITGAMDAGIRGDYTVLFSKSVMDGVTAVTLAATMGIGVLFSGASILIYQGLLTLLAIWVGPLLPDPVVTEMSAAGGLIIAGIGLNMLGVMGDHKIKIGNMLPAIFLPIGYIPLMNWVLAFFS